MGSGSGKWEVDNSSLETVRGVWPAPVRGPGQAGWQLLLGVAASFSLTWPAQAPLGDHGFLQYRLIFLLYSLDQFAARLTFLLGPFEEKM